MPCWCNNCRLMWVKDQADISLTWGLINSNTFFFFTVFFPHFILVWEWNCHCSLAECQGTDYLMNILQSRHFKAELGALQCGPSELVLWNSGLATRSTQTRIFIPLTGGQMIDNTSNLIENIALAAIVSQCCAFCSVKMTMQKNKFNSVWYNAILEQWNGFISFFFFFLIYICGFFPPLAFSDWSYFCCQHMH